MSGISLDNIVRRSTREEFLDRILGLPNTLENTRAIQWAKEESRRVDSSVTQVPEYVQSRFGTMRPMRSIEVPSLGFFLNQIKYAYLDGRDNSEFHGIRITGACSLRNPDEYDVRMEFHERVGANGEGQEFTTSLSYSFDDDPELGGGHPIDTFGYIGEQLYNLAMDIRGAGFLMKGDRIVISRKEGYLALVKGETKEEQSAFVNPISYQ